MDGYDEYEARASTIKIEEITDDDGNQDILHQLKCNAPHLTRVGVSDIDDDGVYVPDDEEDLGWLGYHIGKSSHLKALDLYPTDVSDAQVSSLCRGINRNTSLESISFTYLSGGEIFPRLNPFFNKNCDLTDIGVYYCDLGAEGYRLLSQAIASSDAKSLRRLSILTEGEDLNMDGGANVSNGYLDGIISTLCMHPRLERVELTGLGGITAEGWSAFSKFLCDASSIDKTFHSNHSLQISDGFDPRVPSAAPEDVRYYLNLNSEADKKRVAMTKILVHHPALGMQPFFEWELRVLPLAIGWLERAAAYPVDFEANIGGRKLSTIYQFLRGFPVQCAKARMAAELNRVRASKRKPRRMHKSSKSARLLLQGGPERTDRLL